MERLGGHQTVHCDVRVVAATNRDLRANKPAAAVSRGPLLSPERVSDPGPAAPRAPRRHSGAGPALHSAALGANAARHPLGGRRRARTALLVRVARQHSELQNVVERAVILSPGSVLRIPELGAAERPAPPSSDALADVSRAHILKVLEATNWVVGGPNGAAARLSMKRSTLHFRMKKLGISRVRKPGGSEED